MLEIADDARLLSMPMDPAGGTAPEHRRMVAALAASAMVHALALVVVLAVVRSERPATPIVVFPISLVSLPGDGGGEPGGGTPEPAPHAAAPATEAVPPPPVPAAPIAPPRPVAKPKPAAKPTAPSPAAKAPPAPGATTTPATGDAAAGGPGGSGGGAGGGTGSGGRGITGATPGYGTNPRPPYPVVARRLRLEGTVLLRVVVAPDGAPRDVSIARSSGHDVLDESAATTVRSRWRFAPASRNGAPVEDTVTVPIQFRIDDDAR